MEVLSRVMERGYLNVPLSQSLYSSVVSVVSLGKSIHQFISSSLLRMISLLEELFSKKCNAPLPSRMDVNASKSSHHSLFKPFTIKYHTNTIMECIIAKQKRFQTGQVYSSFHSFRITLQFQ